eukprot:scaffold38710_cov200-Skeletonema_dohrnii-CCMP3373.AAC.3
MKYACIIGCNDEWCEQRPSLGDIGLAKCLSNFIPKQNLLQLYDEYATRSSILSSLERLLDRRNENRDEDTEDSLLFYYGGHGIRTQFCTHTGSGEPQIKHSDIIELLERKFHSGVAWIILDCCYSGSFGEAVLEHRAKANKLTVKYGCIMSVAPDDKAGMEWTMTEFLIKAFQSELLLSSDEEDDRGHYILSTSKGKHPIKNNSIHLITERQVNASSRHPSWEQVIDFLADEMARIKGDRLTTLFIGEGMDDGTILKKPCIFERDEIEQHRYEQSEQDIIPRNLTWTDNDFFHRTKYAINDEVDVKWCGHVKAANSYMIGWFPARICHLDEHSILLSLRDSITEMSWNVTLPIDSPLILAGSPFGFGFDPQDCTNAVSKMAERLCYFDTSLPPFTKVDVLWDDGKVYEGETVLSWSDMRQCVEDVKRKDAVGPYVQIYWAEEDNFSAVPLEKCVAKESLTAPSLKPKDFAKISPKSKQERSNIITPLEAMLASLEHTGKKLLREFPSAAESRSKREQQWEAYDADEDCVWLPVQVMNIDPSLLPLRVLASHMCYQQSGDYVAVFWETDSTLSVIPTTFLRPRREEKGANEDDSSDSSSSDDESSDVEIDQDAADVRKYIEKTVRDELNQVERNTSCCRLRLVTVNDVYSFDDLDSNDESVRGGWSRATSLMKELRCDPSFDTALTIVNGDVLGGSSLLQHCKGLVAIETMNAIPIDLAVLGNHEFDYGDEVLKQRVNESRFDWLGSNVYYPGNSKLEQQGLPKGHGYFPGILGKGTIHTTPNQIKIGFFGLVTKSTPKISSPSKEVVFDADILSVARRTADSLRNRGAHVIIAITHMSEEEDKLLAADKLAGVNLILGGHEHENLALMVHRNEGQDDVRNELNDGGVLVFKCGMNAYWVGCVDLEIEMKTGFSNGEVDVKSMSTSWSMNSVTKTIKEDEAVSEIVKRHRKKTDEDSMVSSFGREAAAAMSLDDVITKISTDSFSLDTRMSSVRRREATGGNLMADAMHWLIQTYIDKDCNNAPTLAMINGGFIRGDRQYSPGSDFTVRHILKELPFPRTMEVLEIQGVHLRDAMRQQLQGSSKGPTGAFPHLSSNSRLEYLIEDVNDNAVSILSFKVNGVEVDDEQVYIIGVTSFVADGNEGCKSWTRSNRLRNAAWDDSFISKVLLQYLSCHRTITPLLEGRVKRR